MKLRIGAVLLLTALVSVSAVQVKAVVIPAETSDGKTMGLYTSREGINGSVIAPAAAESTGSAPMANYLYFKEISAERAQRWYDMGAPYILFYYSHLSENSMAVMRWALETAARENLMVYGVDTDSTNFNNTGNLLTFIWNYMNRGSETTKPAFFFVRRAGSVMPLIQPRDAKSIDFAMTAFYYNITRSSYDASGDDTPQKMAPMPPAILTADWSEVSRDEAIIKYNNNDRFIYVCYNSRNADSANLMPAIWLAAKESGAAVYATDFAGISDDIIWFGKDALNGRQVYAYPTVFFVTGREYIPYASVQPKDVLEIMKAFYNFSR